MTGSNPLRRLVGVSFSEAKAFGYDSVCPKLDEDAEFEEVIYQGSRVGIERLPAKGYPQNW